MSSRSIGRKGALERGVYRCSRKFDELFPDDGSGVRPETADRRGRRQKKAIDAAAALGAPLIHAPSFNDSLIETAADLANTTHFMQKMCDYAADRNILVCTETCLDTARHLELLARVDRKNFKVYFDAQNYDTMAHLYTPELIDPIAEQIVEIHLKDGFDQLSSHRIGEGRCAVFQTMERLLANGYQGWFMLENYYSQSPLCGEDGDFCTPLREDIAIVQRWLETH